MDWNLAIEKNRDALTRIVAMLVAMAALTNSFTSPLRGFEARSSGRASGSTVGREGRGDCGAIGDPGNMPDRRVGVIAAPQPPPDASRRPPLKEEVEPAPTLPRHLHRAILRLLRPAESAVRRLIIVLARGLVVTLPPPRPRKPKPASIVLSKPGGTGIYLPPGARLSGFPLREAVEDGHRVARRPSLPLLDPLRPFRPGPRRPAANSVPRISFPCYTAPSPITPRRPPAPDDPLDATRLALRLQALRSALDDLPAQAKRFARWRARKATGRDAAGAQNRNPDAAGAQNKRLARRAWPLRPGRPPGQLQAKRRTNEVHEVLHDLHWLAFDVLEHPDTS
ncbi:hypothetical protein [Mesorhizobium sp. KR9-304]|uniref:hypothetical protein n=1 Tax=Mesorhizobium sp. KR9-304 TaxID=3156614 RepID=UPI0032B4AA82